MKHFLFSLLILTGILAKAQGGNVHESLWLHSGVFVPVDSMPFRTYAFNSSPAFDNHSTTLHVMAGDTLFLEVINDDSVNHAFAVKAMHGGLAFSPGDTLRDTLVFGSPGMWVYYDSEAAPTYSALGAAGVIAVHWPNQPAAFFWDVKEYESTWSDTLFQGQPVSWGRYQPDYYVVNGNAKTELEGDSTAIIRGNVGDTLLVFMGNTGRGIHSLHYHGFHCEILFSSKYPGHVGRVKDTFAVYPFESIVVRLVPDQPGMYPVHDHNLIATSGGGYVPNGIMMMQLIEP